MLLAVYVVSLDGRDVYSSMLLAVYVVSLDGQNLGLDGPISTV